ncbi:hypothetical protein H8959_014894 [Pygathrix nigripes]
MNHSHTWSKNRCNSRALKPNHIHCHTTRCLLRTMLRNLRLIENNRKQIIQALLTTILLGIYFTLLQISEYYEAPFTISDGIYGSTFFVASTDFTLLSDLHFLLSALFANYYITSHQITILALKPPLDIDTL